MIIFFGYNELGKERAFMCKTRIQFNLWSKMSLTLEYDEGEDEGYT